MLHVTCGANSIPPVPLLLLKRYGNNWERISPDLMNKWYASFDAILVFSLSRNLAFINSKMLRNSGASSSLRLKPPCLPTAWETFSTLNLRNPTRIWTIALTSLWSTPTTASWFAILTRKLGTLLNRWTEYAPVSSILVSRFSLLVVWNWSKPWC